RVPLDDPAEDHAPVGGQRAVRGHAVRVLPFSGGLHHAGLPGWHRLERDVRHADRRPARHNAELPPRRGDGVRDVRAIRGRRGGTPRGYARGRPAPEAYPLIGRSRLLTATVIALVAFIWLPLVVVLVFAFNGGSNLSWPPHGVS